MKVAVAAGQDKKVSQHFGHCDEFVLAEIVDNKVVAKTAVPNPGHRPGFLPRFLKDNGVDVIVSGGMGASAIQLFEELGIGVVTGAAGNVDDILEQYSQGKLVSSQSVCHEHQHKDECQG